MQEFSKRDPNYKFFEASAMTSGEESKETKHKKRTSNIDCELNPCKDFNFEIALWGKSCRRCGLSASKLDGNKRFNQIFACLPRRMSSLAMFVRLLRRRLYVWLMTLLPARPVVNGDFPFLFLSSHQEFSVVVVDSGFPVQAILKENNTR